MSNITFRPANAHDYDFLYALHREAFYEYVDALWGWDEADQQRRFRENFDPSKRRIVQVDGVDAGVLVVEVYPAHVFLEYIAISHAYRGQNVGRQLIQQVIADAASKPVKLSVLASNPAAQRLYKRLGFVVTEQDAYRVQMRYRCEVD